MKIINICGAKYNKIKHAVFYSTFSGDPKTFEMIFSQCWLVGFSRPDFWTHTRHVVRWALSKLEMCVVKIFPPNAA